MKPLLIALAGALLYGAAQACTCMDELSFADGIRLMPLLVEGHVMQAQPDAVPPHIDLKVVRTFKGSVPRYIRVQEQMMCYASIFPSEMRAGERYVIALEPNARGDYTHGVCVETALLREGNELFTFVRTEAGGHKPEKRFYAKYPDFVRRHGTPPPSPAQPAAR